MIRQGRAGLDQSLVSAPRRFVAKHFLQHRYASLQTDCWLMRPIAQPVRTGSDYGRAFRPLAFPYRQERAGFRDMAFGRFDK